MTTLAAQRTLLPTGVAEPPAARRPVHTHILETAHLAGPIAMGQLSKQLMQTATLVLFGVIHPQTLAAGGLAVRITVTTQILSAVLLTVGVSIAVAKGAGDARRVAALYWNGLYLSFLLSLLSFLWFSNAHLLLTALTLPPEVIADTQRCLDIMRWAEPANLITLGLMRGVLPAFGMARILYALTPASLVIYFVAAIAIAKGALGAPPMGWLGIPIALVATKWLAALAMLTMVHATNCRKHIPLGPPRVSVLGLMLRVGVPIGVVQALDTLFFFTTTLMIGRLGAAPLAAHQIVMNYGTITSSFAVSSGDAASLRIGYFRGKREFADARRAGFVGIVMSCVMTAIAAVCVGLFPDFFLGLFIDLHAPETQPIIAIARSLALMSIFWVLTDGVYVASLGLPRATDDNRFAMLVVPLVYWGLGLTTAYLLSSTLQLGLVGFWCAFVLALTVNALILIGRFAWVSRPQAAATAQSNDGPTLARPASSLDHG
ncbi:MATE family efflux transporter [Terrarubrum flagellatum]|uniref:MATE family efflux transporter n=1 Tax=Terrirubrum flagellatum TaxID=2895980 RepID=UPI0031456FBC